MLSKSELKKVRIALNETLDTACRELGIRSLGLGNITFNANGFSSKLEVSFEQDPELAEQKEFEQNCEMYGFKSSDYGRIFNYGKHSYQLVGFQLRARKTPVLAKHENSTDGKRYRFENSTIQEMFEKTETA